MGSLVLLYINLYDDIAGALVQLQRRRSVFWEPRSSSELETTLKQYNQAIMNRGSSTGGVAVLFAVVGAKMSEGINFSDGMAR